MATGYRLRVTGYGLHITDYGYGYAYLVARQTFIGEPKRP